MTDPAGRRGAIDVARAGALVVVVLGHLTLAIIDRGPDCALRGANVLALHPGLAWLAMLSPMPMFFAAAGWANATATPRVAAPRVRTLVGLGAVVVGVWSAASMVELLLRGEGGIIADGARIATQPLWFLAAYAPFTASGSRLSALATRPLATVGAVLAVLIAIDLARFAGDAPSATGWPAFFLAWSVPWMLGAAWRHRHEAGLDAGGERRIGLAVAAAAAATAALLVVVFGYFPSLIDAVPGKRSNTTPPTLFTAVAAIAQVGVLVVMAPLFDRIARRHRRLIDRTGELAVGVYVWHLTALALCAAALAGGLWAPRRFSAGWWGTRPLWFAAVLGVTAVLVAATAAARAALRRHQRARVTPPHAAVLAAGYLLATLGAAVTGLWGPRTAAGAACGLAGFVGGWWLLRTEREPAASA